MTDEIEIITYNEILEALEKNEQECHLLLGNGFNNSLGVKTDYKSIFERMQDDEPIYSAINSTIEQKNYDIEKLIYILKNELQEEHNEINKFLERYIERKVKFDFMKATSGIVREKINRIYKDENQDIFLLFRNFSNYFTLNYDTFLYLLLMKFKKLELKDIEVAALQNNARFQAENLNQEKEEIYNEIKKARDSGELEIRIKDEQSSQTSMKKINKTLFGANIKQYGKSKNKGWNASYIDEVCNIIWQEENENATLECLNDGFNGERFNNEQEGQSNEQGELFDNEQEEQNNEQGEQNVFFLHGSFHIYKKGKLIRKITQNQNKALYERLQEAIESDDKDIVCVLTNNSAEKMRQISDNAYLKKGFHKLSNLQGSMVILGSSLGKNDNHIFDAINKSNVETIYIASSQTSKDKVLGQARNLLPDKSIVLFDYETISYDINNK